MKNLLITLCFILVMGAVFAQPNYKVESYSVAMGKKPGYYHREAERQIKAGNVDMGLLNAAYGLQIAEKKKDISKSQEPLRLSFAAQKRTNLAKIESWKGETATFQNDETVTKLAKIVSLYTIMYQYNDILKTLPAEKFAGAKKKDPTLSLETGDYSSDIATAKAALQKGITDAAQMHYDKGVENMADASNKKANRQAARHFRYSYSYVSGFSDAQQKYTVAKDIGMVKVGVTMFGNQTYKCQDAGGAISNGLTTSLMQKNYEFIEVKNKETMSAALGGSYMSSGDFQQQFVSSDELAKKLGVDYVIVGNIEKCDYKTGIADAGKKSHKKNIVIRTETSKDKDGKTVKKQIKGDVTATGYYKKKFANAVTGSAYSIINTSDGSLQGAGQKSGSNNWEKTWRYSYSGDARALPSESTKPPQDPNSMTIVNNSYGSLVTNLMSDVTSFAKRVTEED
ncbi:MAG: hypothetical protein JXR07_17350 [Reichenbachiella sp.]